MTRRSLELIASADAILYDRLIPPGALEGARPDAELRYVGKEPGAAALSQDETNDLLVELGRAGKRVVRLKGGDPFVFGRGGEEAEALAAAGVPFEVVPGVTAGVAAPAYAGIPVTHRDAASAVAEDRLLEHRHEPGHGDEVDIVRSERVDDLLRVRETVEVLPEARALHQLGRHPGGPGDLQAPAGAVGHDHGDREFGLQQGLQVGPTARDEDADPHHGRPYPSAPRSPDV